MIVVDASAAIAGLLNGGPARGVMEIEALHAPHLIDAEIVQAFRRSVATARISDDDAADALYAWRGVGVSRYPLAALVDRAWDLRHAVSAFDAMYVALAERLGCPLLTADARLARAPGIECTFTVVPG